MENQYSGQVIRTSCFNLFCKMYNFDLNLRALPPQSRDEGGVIVFCEQIRSAILGVRLSYSGVSRVLWLRGARGGGGLIHFVLPGHGRRFRASSADRMCLLCGGTHHRCKGLMCEGVPCHTSGNQASNV